MTLIDANNSNLRVFGLRCPEIQTHWSNSYSGIVFSGKTYVENNLLFVWFPFLSYHRSSIEKAKNSIFRVFRLEYFETWRIRSIIKPDSNSALKITSEMASPLFLFWHQLLKVHVINEYRSLEHKDETYEVLHREVRTVKYEISTDV